MSNKIIHTDKGGLAQQELIFKMSAYFLSVIVFYNYAKLGCSPGVISHESSSKLHYREKS